MKIKVSIIIFAFFYVIQTNAQEESKKRDTLKEITITSNRITMPFSKTSRTITLLTSDEIIKSAATNVADLLQNIAGIDIRKRGTDGMQSDLYIRGGNFDQTLVLIDGVKMDDVQTGHHSMNAIISLDNIERIEVIKGPAARIYGQNAFTGAINIVTKNVIENGLNINAHYGSYENIKTEAAFSQKFDNSSLFASIGYQESEGYRFNTDFENVSAFFKANIKKYSLVSSFTQRKFGANGFYASPDYKDQYEETQTSLVSLGTTFNANSVTIKPRVYWRRNQDMYLFLRHNPPAFRNLHISNKIGAETNLVLNSKLGKTGVGIDVARVFLVSNNLGDHNRTAITGFLEHRFELLDEKLDITPGIAISYYSDFDSQAFPGIDAGYRFSDSFKLYGNIGYTYRVPTFTDLYYVGPTTLGNADLQPESALAEELGIKFTNNGFNIDIAFFNRKSDDLIDWTKDNEEDKWQTRNFSKVITQGFETNIQHNFNVGGLNQSFKIGYSFIDDDIKDENVQYTRYSLNSIKHQFTSGLNAKISKTFNQNISYRYVERTDGTSYNVVDAKLLATLNTGLQLSLAANNIFNAIYTETNLVPMPKGNMMLGLKYSVY
ncbi:TonB-dependent receptor [uncultured Lutibacter sp.]|uniref:TonB-dependent receptor plug domain-containing protein n=1 Tax=uncultured Lutibacter sp. TaxID=437739 RepID=UPI00261D63E1|nr:TonB-dependent receptor [uncultured Lutibacter sp.]